MALIHPDDLPAMRAALEQLEYAGKADVEYRQRAKSGEYRWFSNRMSLVKDKAGRPLYRNGNIRDITVRKHAENVLQRDKDALETAVKSRTREVLKTHAELERSQRMADIGRLSATIAHEMRNPLAVIRTAIFNIRKKSGGPLLDKHFESINKKLLESDQIITNLLSFTNLGPLNIEPINICDLMSDCISSVTTKYADWQVKLAEHFDCNEGAVIEADPTKLKILFSNILDNAYQALCDKSGAITVTISRQNQEFWSISIADTGSGIDEGDMYKIFAPFYTTKAKGTGLGLAICRQIADMHGGSISRSQCQRRRHNVYHSSTGPPPIHKSSRQANRGREV